MLVGDLRKLKTDVADKKPQQKLSWLVEQLRTMGSPGKGSHFDYKILGRAVCRGCFLTAFGVTEYQLNEARSAVETGHGSIRVHGNSKSEVQAARGSMLSTIRGIIYADYVKADEEKIQTGAVYVNMTKGTLAKCARDKITQMWQNNELPQGDSRCREKPPSYDLIVEAIDGMRTSFGEDIHFAKDSTDWFICTTCFDLAEQQKVGFSSPDKAAEWKSKSYNHTM